MGGCCAERSIVVQKTFHWLTYLRNTSVVLIVRNEINIPLGDEANQFATHLAIFCDWNAWEPILLFCHWNIFDSVAWRHHHRINDKSLFIFLKNIENLAIFTNECMKLSLKIYKHFRDKTLHCQDVANKLVRYFISGSSKSCKITKDFWKLKVKH